MRILYRNLVLLGLAAATTSSAWAKPPAGDPPGRDSILDWNAFALQAVVDDLSGTYGAPEQAGPTRASRALAIIHAAMFDALNSIDPRAVPYNSFFSSPGASIDAAVATAAHDTLVAMYPLQADVFDVEYAAYLNAIPNSSAKVQGMNVGADVASALLDLRKNDGSQVDVPYVSTGQPGAHDVDPLNPGQGFLTPGWGSVMPFSLDSTFNFTPLPPPALNSAAYAAALKDVMDLGGDGAITRSRRTAEQTSIGLFWSYDLEKHIGVPPRLYNQIARTIAAQAGNTEAENARLFALVNIAMADAGIVAWGYKYTFKFWRPILGIRRANEDDNPRTKQDANWTPLGTGTANQSNHAFTPPFPSYTSGHATFGGALFRTLERFYARDNVMFTFVSDELNGVTTDGQGVVRPLAPRTFTSFSQAARENARSRIYLGIHWQFDADEGIRSGNAVADHSFDNILQPLP